MENIANKPGQVKYFQVVKRLFSSFREFKLHAILAPIFVAIESIFECLIPYVIALLVDELSNMSSVVDPSTLMSSIITYSLMLVPMAIGALIFGILSARFAAIAALGLSRNIRHDMYCSIQNFSFENIDKFETSGLVTRITTDVFFTQMAVIGVIRIAVRAPMMFIFSLVMALIMAPSLSWVLLVIIPILIVFIFFLIRKAAPIFEKVFKQYDELNDRIEENVKGIRVVKSYVRGDYENDLFKKRAAGVADNFVRADKLAALAMPANQLAIYVVCTVVIYYGGTLLINDANAGIPGNVSIGDINAIILYGIQMLFNLMMLSSVLVNIIMSRTSMRRIYEVLNEKPTILNNDHPILEVKDGSVDFNNVSFKYDLSGKKYALEGVNLHIKSGETIGIIGATGSAKSTFINLIPRLYDASVGEVLVGGVNVKDYDLTVLRDKVAVVLQKNVLFSGTIKSNLLWGNENASDEEIKHACKLACADEFIEGFNDKYEHKIEQGGTNVSGGQKQRLCIARALLKSPNILILDDSTSAVDTKTDAKIRKSFKEYIPHVTKFIIAQRIASVQDADRIIVLQDGKINGVGTHDELMANNQIYRENYISQTRKGGLK